MLEFGETYVQQWVSGSIKFYLNGTSGDSVYHDHYILILCSIGMTALNKVIEINLTELKNTCKFEKAWST